MAYEVMARKRRPQLFGHVAAQAHVTATLQNAIRQGRVAQAYLFSGPRGTGKTTTARLLAMALNCEQGPTDEPCGECASCKSIRTGKSMDVLEIDGASNRGIDEIRQLREEVGYAASKGKRKVYIIDEVHMLTTEAFNALLKTLEEPPPHVVFVFATTEAHKMPETILSRCQRYNFRRIPAEAIVVELKAAVAEEKIEADEVALYQIARKADGGMRDALSLLDQVIAFSDGPVTAEIVQELLGIIPRDLYFELTDAIGEKSSPRALGVIERLMREGGDPGEFVDGLVAHFRHLLVARATGELVDDDLPEADRVRYAEVAKAFDENDLLRMLNAVSELAHQLARVSDPRLWLELTVMKLVKMTATVDLADLMGRLEKLERALKGRGGAPSAMPQRQAPRPAPPARSAPPVRTENGSQMRRPAPPPPMEEPPPPESQSRMSDAPPPMPSAPPESPASAGNGEPPTLDAIAGGWERFVQEVKGRKISVGTFLSEGRPQALDGQQLVVAFERNKEFHANQVRRNRSLVEEVACMVFGGPVHISCEVDYGASSGGAAEQESSPEEDDRVQMVLQVFGGEVLR